MRCPSCKTENLDATKFCGNCGQPLKNRCAKCGAENPPQFKFCGECGGALIDSAEAERYTRDTAKSEGERRHLTVLFCDLVGSTALAAQLDPEEWRAIVADYHRAAADAIERFGGYVAQYLGDGVMAFFGWPEAHENDAERAARAGLAILEAIVKLNEAPGRPRLSARVGIDSGAVVVGTGAEKGADVFGDAPNIAARVQAVAEPDTVLITDATHHLVSGLFVMEPGAAVSLKGIERPVQLYRVIQPSGVRGRLDITTGRFTPFIGREVELATLVDRWERAREGEGQNVLVVGEAGVGKSRLTYQLRQHLTTMPHTWLESGATPYTEGTPFHPVIALVSQGLGFASDDTQAEKLAKLEGGLGGLASAETVALIAAFLGLSLPTSLQMSPDLQRRKTIDLVTRWHLAISEVQPLVVLVEDLHWCDPSSLELLGRLIEQSPTARVLLIATTRPEFTPGWPARENVTTLSLARLTKRQARDMVAALADEKLAADMRDALVARADGVPLFIEELTKSLVETGAERGVASIPATLADSLMGRLDRLSAAKDVAQRAAVLGREFSYQLLAAVAVLEDAALRQGLARLVEAEILFVRGEPPEATYTFKHALVQEAAYGSLLKRTRQQLHSRVVDVLMKEYPERAAVEPEVVARHAELAGRIDEAVASYRRAGQQAELRSAHAEAISHLRHAIALLATQPESAGRDSREIPLQLAVGYSIGLGRGLGHVEFEVAFERARILCEATGDSRRLGHALNGLAEFSRERGKFERACGLGVRMLAIAEQSVDRQMALMGHYQIGLAELLHGKFASSLGHVEQVRAMYEPERMPLAVVYASNAVGLAALNIWVLGWPDRALARSREAVSLARRLGNPLSLTVALFIDVYVHWLLRDAAGQRERAAELIALGETHGFPLYVGLGRMWYAAARVAAGEAEAIADLPAGFALCAETGRQGGATGVFALLGTAYMSTGRFNEARGAIEQGLAGRPNNDAELHRLQGEIVLATGGSGAEAEAFFHQALDIARAQGSQVLRAARDHEPRSPARIAG
jgi:class 3 adenylate cyclase/tetratricopeptide (TPR) repeat protein